jgi:hypothetical protein
LFANLQLFFYTDAKVNNNFESSKHFPSFLFIENRKSAAKNPSLSKVFGEKSEEKREECYIANYHKNKLCYSQPLTEGSEWHMWIPSNIYQLPKRHTLPLLHKFKIYNIIIIILYILRNNSHTHPLPCLGN